MRARLGEVQWNAFVRYAEAHHKDAFLNALTPPSGELCCAGKIDGTPCPHSVRLTLTDVAQATQRLECFHLDHTYDAAHICQVWSAALPPEPTSWHDGLSAPLIAQLLFGVDDHPMTAVDANPVWRKQLTVRCGNRKGEGQRAADFCHDVANAHYSHPLTAADLRPVAFV